MHRLFPFEFGSFGPLHVRHERVELGIGQRLTLVFASDLHLGLPWTNPMAPHLVKAVHDISPQAVILGGDLADTRPGLRILGDCIADLTSVAPVFAIAGNHDARLGLERIGQAVVCGGGAWLKEASFANGQVVMHGEISNAPATAAHQILCAHDPAIFPAAVRAGYRLVLAGHLHGGQCVLNTRDGRLYPGALFARWTGLRFSDGKCTMLVSRGAADTLPLRWNCPREIIACEIA